MRRINKTMCRSVVIIIFSRSDINLKLAICFIFPTCRPNNFPTDQKKKTLFTTCFVDIYHGVLSSEW
jgi:hypothetical protein